MATAAYKTLLALLGDTHQHQALTGSLTRLPTGISIDALPGCTDLHQQPWSCAVVTTDHLSAMRLVIAFGNGEADRAHHGTAMSPATAGFALGTGWPCLVKHTCINHICMCIKQKMYQAKPSSK